MKYLKDQEISQFSRSGNIFILLMASMCDHGVKQTTAPSRDITTLTFRFYLVKLCFCNQANVSTEVVKSNGSAYTSKKR
jgi:hypothetical protein